MAEQDRPHGLGLPFAALAQGPIFIDGYATFAQRQGIAMADQVNVQGKPPSQDFRLQIADCRLQIARPLVSSGYRPLLSKLVLKSAICNLQSAICNRLR
jgi:hypothetical protein